MKFLSYFKYFLAWLTSQEKGAFVPYEKATIQTYHTIPNEYQGVIELNGVAIAVYYIDNNCPLRLRFKHNDDEDIAYESFVFKPEDSLEKLLPISEKYIVAKEIYEFFMKF